MSPQLIGVDVGGTKVSVASLTEAGLDSPRIMPTSAAGEQALVDEIVRAIEDVRGPDAAAIGVGVPSVVEFATGRVKSSSRDRETEPLTPAEMEAEEALGKDGEKDEPAGDDGLHDRQRRKRKRRHVERPRAHRDREADRPRGRPEEVRRAAQQMVSIDGRSGHGAPVLEQKREVRADRGQNGECETENHRVAGVGSWEVLAVTSLIERSARAYPSHAVKS
jgi:hypothetical protein